MHDCDDDNDEFAFTHTCRVSVFRKPLTYFMIVILIVDGGCILVVWVRDASYRFFLQCYDAMSWINNIYHISRHTTSKKVKSSPKSYSDWIINT